MQVNTSVIHGSDRIFPMEDMAARLKRLRKEAGLTQAQLAARANVSQGTIGNIESGMRGYGKSLVDISRALGVPADYLAGEAAVAAALAAVSPKIGTDEYSITAALMHLARIVRPLGETDRAVIAAMVQRVVENPDLVEQAAATAEKITASVSKNSPEPAKGDIRSRLPQHLGPPLQEDFEDAARHSGKRKGQ